MEILNNQPMMEKVAALLATVKSRKQIAAICQSKLEIPADQIDAVLAEATRQLICNANYDAQLELGTAITRLNTIYQTNAQSKPATALSAQRELNRLQRLQPQPAPQTNDEADDAAEKRPRDPNAEATYDAIDQLLDPLLPTDPNATYPDRIKQAAKLLKTKPKAQKKTTPKKSKTAKKSPQKKHDFLPKSGKLR